MAMAESFESLDDSPSEVESIAPTHEFPGELQASGARFPIVWTRLWQGKRLLNSSRVGYRVKGRGQLLGKRELASFWRYGAELEYVEENGKKTILFLCQSCHTQRKVPDCWVVDSTAHIKRHLKKVHSVDPDTGLLPIAEALQPQTPWQHATAGSSSAVSHHLWQEEELQSAYVDWVMVNDLSFKMCVDPSTRGILTWNRTPLLRALPASHTTLSKYVELRLAERKVEILELLAESESRISVSCDMWTSPNRCDFLGVVAHFVGKSVFLTGTTPPHATASGVSRPLGEQSRAIAIHYRQPSSKLYNCRRTGSRETPYRVTSRRCQNTSSRRMPAKTSS
jgi:hypothetical protein